MSICEDCDRQYRCPKTTTDKEVVKCKFYYPKPLKNTFTNQGNVTIYQPTRNSIKHEVIHGFFNLNEEDFEPVYYNPEFLEEMKKIEKEKPIKVSTIDELFDEGIDLYELEEKVEKLIKANNGIVRSVEQLETKHKESSERLYGRNRSIDTLIEDIFIEIKHLKEDIAFSEKNIRSLKLEVDAISADNEYLEKKMNYHIKKKEVKE